MIRLNWIVILISVALLCVLAEELYSGQYDQYINIHDMLNNDELRQQYYNCYMDTGPCITADSKFFKVITSEAIQTNCKKCTEKQKDMLNMLSDWYKKNKPVLWQNIVQKSLEDMKKKNAGQ